MNPKAQHMVGMIKLDKHQNPIRPIVNWKDSPSYKLAKFITLKLKEIIQLPNAYNIQNSINLIKNLNKLKINENIKLCSFDITNMYTNISLTGTNIVHSILNNDQQIHSNIKHELITYHVRTKLHTVRQRILQTKQRLIIGEATSAILAEVFDSLQYIYYKRTRHSNRL
jgi:hypothetical protein